MGTGLRYCQRNSGTTATDIRQGLSRRKIISLYQGMRSCDTKHIDSTRQVLSSEDARLTVSNIGAAINPGGRIYIIGQILDDSRITPPEAVGFNLSLISQFDSGESYTEQEHRSWLSEAGFVEIERANFLLPDEHGVMTARKRV